MAFIKYDIKTTCRICLIDCPGVISLFNSEYYKLLRRCANINVLENDSLPAGICEVCIKELLQAYEFVVKCQEADEKLRLSVECAFTSRSGEYEVCVKEEPFANDNIADVLDHDEYCDLSDEVHISTINSPLTKRTSERVKKTREKRKRSLPSSNPPGPCPVCGLVVKSNSAMIIHNRKHSGERPFECSDCGKKFSCNGTLKGHVNRFHSNIGRTFTCEICGKDFYRKKNLVVHIRRHTGETPYSCPFCSRSFNQQSSLIRHKRTHTGERPYSCKTCDKTFACLTRLNNHQFVHSNEKKFSCDICNVSLKWKESLAKHKTIHTGVKPHICEKCGLSFLLKGNLKLHLRNVHSERSGECSICNKRFSNLEDHLRKHTGETPFQCHICSRCFAHKSSLSAHVNKHQNADKYPCTLQGCSKKFPVQSMLDFHILKYHKQSTPHACSQCGRGFFRPCDLKKHFRTCHSLNPP